MSLEQTINRGSRDEITLDIGNAHGQLSGLQLGLIQSQAQDPGSDSLENAVPDATRLGATILQRVRPPL